MTSKPIDTPLYQRRNHAQRRKGVAWLLAEHPEYSDRRIANILAVGRELVRDIRREMINRCLIQSHHALRRIGADGKTYTRLPRPKGDRFAEMRSNA